MTTPPPRTFADFGLDPRIQTALDELGFVEPTDIQTAALPALLTGRDVIGRAQTGSGKTAAFGIPLLERVKDSGPGVRALVLAPTRELAQQVSAALQSYGKGLGLHGVTVYGGAPYGPQLKALRRGVPIVVGTPGRLIDHLGSGALDLSQVEYVVLDEADEMLRMGFVDDVETMLGAIPRPRQVALFSATMPDAIKRIAATYLEDPLTIQMNEGAPATSHITQAWTRVPNRFKPDALRRAVLGGDRGTTLVFARTRASCGDVTSHLEGLGLRVEALHGDMAQAARERTLAKLRAGEVEVVVCTDIAARGIDVDHITQVVNLDLPENAEVYVHRIGRTGRAGRAGRALTMVTPAEIRKFSFFQKKINQPVQEVQLPSDRELARKGRERLLSALDDDTGDDATGWLAELLADGERTAEDVAAAALSLLGRMQGIPLSDESFDDGPPPWAQRTSRPERPPGPPRHASPYAAPPERGAPERSTPPRPPGPPRKGFAGSPPPVDEGGEHVELFVPLGSHAGLRASDLVGALANEAGIPGSVIGRITIHERKSFVGLPPDVASHVLQRTPRLEVRGRQVALSRSRGKNAPLPAKFKKPKGPHRR
jgi:ATP-dependent RNA helicase DeaD